MKFQHALAFCVIFTATTYCHGKTLVVLMDGTWNNAMSDGGELSQLKSLWADSNYLTSNHQDYPETLPEDATNIARLFNLLQHDDEQHVAYVRGVGTHLTEYIGGGLAGDGTQQRVSAALEFLEKHWQVGDDLSIVGFSRGASSSRLLAIRLAEEGLHGTKPVEIRFLGLFDTVAAFGVPDIYGGLGNGFEKRYDDYYPKLRIPDSVKLCVHLVAWHEDRTAFVPTLISKSPINDGRRKEIWFGGSHGDVGGGWEEPNVEYRRRQITLRWLLEQDHGMRLKSNWRESPDVKVSDSNFGEKHSSDDHSKLPALLMGAGNTIREPSGRGENFPVPYRPDIDSEFVHASTKSE